MYQSGEFTSLLGLNQYGLGLSYICAAVVVCEVVLLRVYDLVHEREDSPNMPTNNKVCKARSGRPQTLGYGKKDLKVLRMLDFEVGQKRFLSGIHMYSSIRSEHGLFSLTLKE